MSAHAPAFVESAFNLFNACSHFTANNRVLLAYVRHRFGDPKNITDHEHLDPYRADATHLPATQWLRQTIGDVASRRFGINW